MSLLTKRPTRMRGVLTKTKSKSEDIEFTVNDLPALRRKRTITYKRLSKAFEIGTLAMCDSSQRDLFLSYHQEIKNISASFEQAHFAILHLTGEPEPENDEIQESFDDLYFQVLSIYRSLTKCESTPSQCNSSNIRLPKINLPRFSGDIKQWPEYYDTFNALIHNSKSLSDTEKFHYLVSSLSGDALSVVKTFPVIQQHYFHAYDALTARYQNKRDLAFTCWREILNVEFKIHDAINFRKSLDAFEENLSILKTIDLPVHHWDFILVYHILSKLDKVIRRDFEEKYSSVDLPSYAQLKEFLHSKCEALVRDTHFSDSPKPNKPIQKWIPANPPPKRNYTSTLVAATNEIPNSSITNKCSFCDELHSISTCSEFLKKSPEERMQVASDKRWCYNCLKPSHQLMSCRSIFSCRTCKRKHHTLLHRDKPIESNQTTSSLVSRSPSSLTVLLATAIVQVRDASGDMQSFRCLFDTGSQSNFITESAINRLNLKPTRSNANISGLGEAAASIIGDVTCSIGINNTNVFTLNMHVISKICGDQPIAKLNTTGWSHINTLPLADPGFDIPGPIDILLAADVFADSLLGQHIKGSVNQPTAFNSIFGWLLLGKTGLASTNLHCSFPDLNIELNSLAQRFRELDSLSSKLTHDGKSCERKSVLKHFRDESGRYTDSLSFKRDVEPHFEGSREVVSRHFYAIERRLSRDPALLRKYSEFMSYYIKSGHMSLVPVNEVGTGKNNIPHHCLLRPDSTTISLRLVFDASANDSNSRSFNDSQLIGSKLQPNILDIILRFKDHDIAIMVHAQQMYRQIMISPSHCDYQRIFWRFSPSETLQEYRLKTVIYGVSSSPFLACRTLQQLSEDEGKNYPLAKQTVMSDACIDGIATETSKLDKAKQAKQKLIVYFRCGSFPLKDLSPGYVFSYIAVSLDTNPESSAHLKVLGLKWDLLSYTFLIEIQPSDRPCTKRSILSEIARIFDPLGFLSPATIQAKCLIQNLWVLGVDWDVSPPDEVISAWNNYREQLPMLAQLSIPRKLTYDEAISYQLHGFCDGSEKAHGAVIYLRKIDKNVKNQVFVICSKTQNVPFKRTLLPRLELCAAVLYADICSRGHLPGDTLHKSLWWAAPCWSSQDDYTWLSHSNNVSYVGEANTLIQKPIILLTERDRNNATIDRLLKRYSTLREMIGVLVYVNRIITNFRTPSQANVNTTFNHVERHTAFMQIVKHAQIQFFAQTILSIEILLTSRPLSPISTDPNDLSVLTPGHFLTLEPLTAAPDEDLSNVNVNRLHRWQLIQAFQQNFWSRWKHEYLNSLTQRAKWTKHSKPLHVGSMVIIKDDIHTPLQWPLGRVVELLPGADGVARIAIIKTAHTTMKRPLVRLCPLLIDN